MKRKKQEKREKTREMETTASFYLCACLSDPTGYYGIDFVYRGRPSRRYLLFRQVQTALSIPWENLRNV